MEDCNAEDVAVMLMVSVKICLFSLWVIGVWFIKQEISLTWSGQLYIIESKIIIGCS